MSDPILEKFKQFSCFDVGYVEGLSCPMAPEVRPIMPGFKMVGRAFTVNEINAICKNIFDEIGKDEVLVVRGQDPKRMGGCGLQICELIAARGAVGAVIDGGAQDTPKLRKLGFPVFCCYIVPTHGALRLVGETQAPIECGGVHVRPGDIVMGDDDGVVVIPRCNENKVLRQVELMREARDYVDAVTRKGVPLWDIPGLKDMWAEKERGLDYHWKVYEKWNAQYIPPEMRRKTT
ncbi:MAG: RraA family protein [Chloroflexota bacterium]